MSTQDALFVGESPSSLASIPRAPIDMSYGLMDISSPDAGRTQDANSTMHKMRVGQKRKLSLSWANLSLRDTSTIFRAFDPEYVYVKYVDPKDGDWRVVHFYTGDKSSAYRKVRMPNGTVMKTLSFDLIEV